MNLTITEMIDRLMQSAKGYPLHIRPGEMLQLIVWLKDLDRRIKEDTHESP